MAALVIVALFWGNCFSCPQILLSLKTHQASHACCKRGQKPMVNTCQNQGMQHFLKTDPASVAQLEAPSAAALMVVALTPPMPQAAVTVVVGMAAHAPPDLLSMHSSFRI